MTPDEYIKQRLEPQIVWYSRKSRSNHNWYLGLRASELVLAASLPWFAAQVPTYSYFPAVTGAIGVIIAIISGLLGLQKFQENWLQYRATCEKLRMNKFRFLASAAPYNTSDAFSILVASTEDLISTENTAWVERIASADRTATNVAPPGNAPPG